MNMRYYIHRLCVQFINLIMDFVKKHSKVFYALAATTVAAIFALVYAKRTKGKQTIAQRVYISIYESLEQQFHSKIRVLKQNNNASMPKEDLTALSLEIAKFIEDRTRIIEKQTYQKAAEWKLKGSFQQVVNLILADQQNNETLNNSFIVLQQRTITSFNLQPEQQQTLKQQIQQILKNKKNTINEDVLNQARIILSSKNEFLRANGEKLVEDIKVTCKDWTKSSLKYLPNILNVIINEAVYSHHPESIESLLQIIWAIQTQQRALQPQLAAWQASIDPIYKGLLQLINKNE